MNNNGKIKIRKKNRTSKLGNTLLFLLIFLLSISTLITIQIRSAKQNKKIAEQYSQTSALEYTDNTPKSNDATVSTDENTIETSVNSELMPTNSSDVVYSETAEISTDEKKEINYTMPLNGKLTKAFSKTKLVHSATMNDWRLHLGADIECNVNLDIKSMADGVVYDIYNDKEYGTTIVVEHEDGVMTRYSNVDVNPELTFGSRVEQGTVLGWIKENPPCERIDGYHVHVEAVADNVLIDPLSLINN